MITFAPPIAGTVSGRLDVTSNATNSTFSIALSGSGVTAQHFVDLAWDASTSAVAGYYIYRGDQSGGPYVKLNSSPVAGLSFTDGTVLSGHTYYYVVTSVTSDGVESDYSTELKISIP